MTDPWKIAQENQGLIKSYLSKNRWIIDKSHTLEYEDYWQIGLIALHRAAENHNPEKRKFSTYAYVCLKWNLTRAFKTQAFPIMRVPEKKHPRKDADLSAMNYKEAFTYNVLNCRVDLSATNYINLVGEPSEEEQTSGMFVFFK